MEEFMLVIGENALVEQIKKCFETDSTMPSALHDAAMQLYRQYLVVGGMAENYVNVQLSINGYNTYYWESERGQKLILLFSVTVNSFRLRSSQQTISEQRA